MSQAEFINFLKDLRKLPHDADKLHRLDKKQLSENLNLALTTLKVAEEIIAKQSDTVQETNSELIQQCSENRKLHGLLLSPSNCSSKPSSITAHTFAEAIKKPFSSLVLKPKEDRINMNSDAMQGKVHDALRNINVSSIKLTKQGIMIINLPNEISSCKASENLKHVLDANVEASLMKKLAPKLTFVGLPKDINPDELKIKLCEKDELLKKCLEKKTLLRLLDLGILKIVMTMS